MSTVRDVVSRVRSANKMINSDDLITDRLIAAEVKSKSIVLIKRELNLRKLWNTDTIFTTIPCLPMEQVPLSECCDYRSDRVISRTTLKLPAVSEGNYAYAIMGVFDLDSSVEIKYMTPKRFINRLKLKLYTNDVYYWIANGYLYVTNPNVKNLRLVAFFEEDVPIDMLFPTDCKCQEVVIDICINPLDLEFKCPGYLENQVVEMTSQYIRQTYLSTTDIKTQANQDTQKRQ